jgi:hypothetical protein
MKTFRAQFSECSQDNLVLKNAGPEITIQPAFPNQAFIDKVNETGKLPVMRTSLCGRFGGTCSSQHSECLKLRNSYQAT